MRASRTRSDSVPIGAHPYSCSMSPSSGGIGSPLGEIGSGCCRPSPSASAEPSASASVSSDSSASAASAAAPRLRGVRGAVCVARNFALGAKYLARPGAQSRRGWGRQRMEWGRQRIVPLVARERQHIERNFACKRGALDEHSHGVASRTGSHTRKQTNKQERTVPLAASGRRGRWSSAETRGCTRRSAAETENER